MMISIIIIVPPLRNRSGKNADRCFYRVHLARTAAATRARAHVCRCSLKVLRGDPNLNWTSL